MRIDEQPDYWMVDGDVVHVPGFADDRYNADSRVQVIDSQQRWSWIGIGSINYHVVKIEAGRDAIETQRVVTGFDLRSKSSGELLLRCPQNILMNGTAVQQDVYGEYCRDDQKQENACRPCSDSLPTSASRRLLDKAWSLGRLTVIRR